MLWSLIKILLFVGIAAGLAYGAGMIMETPGEVTLAFAGREVTLSPLGFILAMLVILLAVWILLKIVGFLVAILRFITGDQTAITRYLDRNRERKGFDALTQSMLALAAGEGRKAQAKAALAEKLLDRPELTRLVKAQTAELNGNADQAAVIYKEMLTDDRTRFVAVQGLLRQKLANGDTATALKLAEKAFALQPRHVPTLDTLFDLQTRAEDWGGARRTLSAKVRAASLPKDVGNRREAVLSLADARAALEDGNTARARDAAYAANKMSPTFGPAAALAAEMHAKLGEPRHAARIVKKAWTEAPHPDLAAAFASIAPDETPDERVKRFQLLLKINPDNAETRMVAAELALAAEDFPGARRALGDLAGRHPTTRSLAIMAAIERGEGAPDSVVRGWLAKALSAPRGEAWVCGKCNTAHGSWVPICSHCESFDTLAWTLPPQTDDSETTTAMLPLIVGALDRPDASARPAESGAAKPADKGMPPEPDPMTDPESTAPEVAPGVTRARPHNGDASIEDADEIDDDLTEEKPLVTPRPEEDEVGMGETPPKAAQADIAAAESTRAH